MIRTLRIKNLGLIKETNLDLKDELISITGETGTGKTMVLSAIAALLGDKLSNNLLHDSQETLIEAHFDFTDPKLQMLAKENDFTLDEGYLIASRIFSKEAKSKSFLGGRSIPASQMGEFLTPFIFVHGQKDQNKLTKPAFALQKIDAMAGAEHKNNLQVHKEIFSKLKDLKNQLRDFDLELELKRDSQAKLEQLVLDVEAISPEPDEDLHIAQRILNLQSSEKIKFALAKLMDLDNEDFNQKIIDAEKAINNLPEEIFPQISQHLIDLQELISQIIKSTSNFYAEFDSEGSDLDALESRRFQINRLMKLYGPKLSDVLENAEKAKLAITQIADPGNYRDSIIKEIEHYEKTLNQMALKISKTRLKVAKEISDSVTKELKDLMLAEAEFHIQVSQMPPLGAEHTQNGIDQIQINFRSNSALPWGEASKIASGGELSRLMLALEVSSVKETLQRVMIFDEIDAGVGGKAALEIAKRLKKLANYGQVMLVTHLPQVAAFSKTHLVVSKEGSGSDSYTEVKPVKDEFRQRELSRMFAGLEGSQSALQHADELLELAKTYQG